MFKVASELAGSLERPFSDLHVFKANPVPRCAVMVHKLGPQAVVLGHEVS